MNLLLNNKLIVAGIAIGAILGYAYYHFVGCSGGCSITSDPLNSTLYGALIGGLFTNVFKKNNKENAKDMEKLIKENKGTVVDVRTHSEFSGGNVAGSINIPLNEIPSKIAELKKLEHPLILCCASGNRSGQASQYLSKQGIECYNAGSWMDVNYYKSKTNE